MASRRIRSNSHEQLTFYTNCGELHAVKLANQLVPMPNNVDLLWPNGQWAASPNLTMWLIEL